MEQRLSDFLLGQIELYNMDGANRPSKVDQAARFILETIAEEIVAGREAFTGEEFEVLGVRLDVEKAIMGEPEETKAEMDRVLSCRTLENVPAMVDRLVHLSKLNAVRIPSDQTAVYIREAARTYCHGLFQASAAMSRAALEQAIKEALGRQGAGDFIRTQGLLKEAKERNVLDAVTCPAVRDTLKKANRVMHEAPTDEAGAREILVESRALVVQIYAVNGGF